MTLLKPVQGGETLTLQLAKRGRVGDRVTWPNSMPPSILVEGAALEQGEIAVRKSPRLDLRTLDAQRACRGPIAAGRRRRSSNWPMRPMPRSLSCVLIRRSASSGRLSASRWPPANCQ